MSSMNEKGGKKRKREAAEQDDLLEHLERVERKLAVLRERAAALPPPCPEILKTLQDMKAREVVCLGEKTITGSDVKSDLGRLFIPRDSSSLLKPRLRAAERMAVEPKDAAGIGVKVVDWTGGKWDLRFQYWSSVRMFILNNGWNEFVRDRDLLIKIGDRLRFWAFRHESGKLGFAIQR